MDQQEVNKLKELEAAATPAPWQWEKDHWSHTIRLMTPRNGHCIVMDFVRWGMQSAQPRFSDRGNAPLGGIMQDGAKIDLDKNADAALIPAMRNAFPEMIAALIEEQWKRETSPGAEMITTERLRQVAVKGYTTEHDSQYKEGELIKAARAYIIYAMTQLYNPKQLPAAEYPIYPWPFAGEFWHPEADPKDNLAKAGAFLAAEIDRLMALS